MRDTEQSANRELQTYPVATDVGVPQYIFDFRGYLCVQRAVDGASYDKSR